jgi:O-antigen/teichoic acid export membrane protein
MEEIAARKSDGQEGASAAPATTLRGRTARNVAVVGIFRIVDKLIRIPYRIVIARLLFPFELGIVTVSESFISICSTFTEFGIAQAGVFIQGDERRILGTTFLIQLFISSLTFAVVFFTAPLWAVFFDQPELTGVARVLAFNLVISALAYSHSTKLTRDLRFGTLSFARVFAFLCAAALTIALALSGFGFWSLVWGAVVNVAVFACVCILASGISFSIVWDRAVLRAAARYGVPMYAATVLIFLGTSLDVWMAGKMGGMAVAGLYGVAVAWGAGAALEISRTMSTVAFPTFVKIRDDPVRLGVAFVEHMRYLLFVIAPVSFGLAVAAPEFVRLVLGPRWEPATVALQLLCLCALFRGIGGVCGNIFVSYGKPVYLALSSSLVLVLMVPAGYFGMKFRGIDGLAAGVTAANALVTVFVVYMAVGLAKVSIGRLVKAVFPPVAAAGVTAGLVFLALRLCDVRSTVVFLAVAAGGAVLYLLVSMALQRGNVRNLVKMFRAA